MLQTESSYVELVLFCVSASSAEPYHVQYCTSSFIRPYFGFNPKPGRAML